MNAWLIEVQGPMWLMADVCGWHYGTAGEAIRFARKVDAEAVLSCLRRKYADVWPSLLHATVAEHSWPEDKS